MDLIVYTDKYEGSDYEVVAVTPEPTYNSGLIYAPLIPSFMKANTVKELKQSIEQSIADEKSFESRLMEKYPEIFPKDPQGNPRNPDCGIFCPKGWEHLVDRLCECIHSRVLNDNIAKQSNVYRYAVYSRVHRLVIRPILRKLIAIVDPSTTIMKHVKIMPVAQLQEIRDASPFRSKVTRMLQSISAKLYPRYKYDRQPIPSFCIDQIKEKFGTLRFYYTGGDPIIHGMIDFAEYMSGYTCEITGEPGCLHVKGKGMSWYKTLSETIANEKGYVKVKRNN